MSDAERTTRRHRMFTVTGTLALFIVLTLGLVAGSYAQWNKTLVVQPTGVKTGSMALTINGATATTLDPTTWSSLTPGHSGVQAFLLSNTGNAEQAVNGSIAVSSTDPIKDFMSITVGPVATSADCLPGLTGPAAPLTGFTMNEITLPAEASTWMCVEVALGPAPVTDSGQTATFTLTMTGTQQP